MIDFSSDWDQKRATNNARKRDIKRQFQVFIRWWKRIKNG